MILALDTSSRRGSAALVQGGVCVVRAAHSEPNAHAERLLGLVNHVLACARLDRRDIDLVAVGRGPGSFTGLRIGLALAQGIALGLGVSTRGVGSMRAMAAAVPGQIPGLRWVLTDARRGEVFCACYDLSGRKRLAPCAVARQRLAEFLLRERARLEGEGAPASNHLLVGEAGSGEGVDYLAAQGFGSFRSDESDLPDAGWIGLIAEANSDLGPALPDYVREPDAQLPNLPPSPLRT